MKTPPHNAQPAAVPAPAGEPCPLCPTPAAGASAGAALPPGSRILLTAAQIQTRIRQIAGQISTDYKGLDLLTVAVLEGARPFHRDLVQRLTVPAASDAVQTSSYGHAHASSGVVTLSRDLTSNITGRHVLLVDDIVDSGHTAAFLIDALARRRPASLKLCALLDKPCRRVTPVAPHYTCFTINDVFVFGYGLDYKGQLRDLPYVAAIPPSPPGEE
ncbi:MAG TPA: hypoxanthine phosphoribosyltransferase [Candidatus Brocadiia bacterium]|nr:hypoxanthine phosphoribosyltransferase [Candidatus Brocadiia bacterium]